MEWHAKNGNGRVDPRRHRILKTNNFVIATTLKYWGQPEKQRYNLRKSIMAILR
jgi:hypothetical protein